MHCSAQSQEFKVQEGREVFVEGEIQEDTGRSVSKEDMTMRNPRLAVLLLDF